MERIGEKSLQDCGKDLKERDHLVALGIDGNYDYIKMVKVKVNFPLEQVTKTHRGSRGIALIFLQPRR